MHNMETLELIQKFFNEWNSKTEFVEQLGLIYDYIDDCPNGPTRLKFSKTLLIIFNNKDSHLSTLKTMLLATKDFKDNPVLSNEHNSLRETYEKLRAFIIESKK